MDNRHNSNPLTDFVTRQSRLVPLPKTLQTWRQRWKQRRALCKLDSHRLRDIGLTEQQAREECRKPFWQE